MVKEFVFYRDNYHLGFSCQVKDKGVPREYEILLGPGMGNPSKEEAKNRYFFFGRVLLETAPPGGEQKSSGWPTGTSRRAGSDSAVPARLRPQAGALPP